MSLQFRTGIWLRLLAFLSAGVQPVEWACAEGQEQVVARVDGEAITAADVDREIELAFPGSIVDPRAVASLRRKTTEQLIQRELVLRYLRDVRQSASPADVDLAIDRIKKRLAQREESFDKYLESRRLDELGLRRALTWQIGWGRLLERYLSDANLQRFFETHRREFDGTQIGVAHILFPVAATADSATRSAARQRAVELLVQIRGRQLTFSEAAKRYSSGPSRDTGGDIGLISRHETMPEPFSRAAFELDLNQISEPVETAFGFHLIQCLEIRPGQKRWLDVRPELEKSVTEYLFNWAADQARPQSKVEWEP